MDEQEIEYSFNLLYPYPPYRIMYALMDTGNHYKVCKPDGQIQIEKILSEEYASALFTYILFYKE